MNGALYVMESEEKSWQRHVYSVIRGRQGVFCGESKRQLWKHEISDAIVLCFSAGAYDVQLLVVVYFIVLERKFVVDYMLLQIHGNKSFL